MRLAGVLKWHHKIKLKISQIILSFNNVTVTNDSHNDGIYGNSRWRLSFFQTNSVISFSFKVNQIDDPASSEW